MAADITDIPNIVRAVRAAWPVGDEALAAHIDIANWGRVLHQDTNKRLSHAFVDRLQLTPAERYRVFLAKFHGLANRVKLRYVADFLGMSIYTLSRIRAGI